jgi:hypothetical protein
MQIYIVVVDDLENKAFSIRAQPSTRWKVPCDSWEKARRVEQSRRFSGHGIGMKIHIVLTDKVLIALWVSLRMHPSLGFK